MMESPTFDDGRTQVDPIHNPDYWMGPNDEVPQYFEGRRPVGAMTTFDTGATRTADENKLDFEGFLSPLALQRYAEYLHEHRRQADGTTRDSDNWQKGMPIDRYIKSAWRHFFDWWKLHRADPLPEVGAWEEDSLRAKQMEDDICGLIFNAMGYLHEHLKARGYQ